MIAATVAATVFILTILSTPTMAMRGLHLCVPFGIVEPRRQEPNNPNKISTLFLQHSLSFSQMLSKASERSQVLSQIGLQGDSPMKPVNFCSIYQFDFSFTNYNVAMIKKPPQMIVENEPLVAKSQQNLFEKYDQQAIMEKAKNPLLSQYENFTDHNKDEGMFIRL